MHKVYKKRKILSSDREYYLLIENTNEYRISWELRIVTGCKFFTKIQSKPKLVIHKIVI